MPTNGEQTALLDRQGPKEGNTFATAQDLSSGRDVALPMDDVDADGRADMVKEEQQKIRNMMEFNLLHCILAITLYLVASVACFSYWLEEWSIIDSVYFAVVTFTTIGYGDVVPDTLLARLFTCVWALSGVACLGIFLGVLATRMVDVAEQGRKDARKLQRKEILDIFNADTAPRPGDPLHVAPPVNNVASTVVEKNEALVEKEVGFVSQCCSWLQSPKTRRLALLLAIIGVILYAMATTEGWGFWLTVYYGIITASTVGYGDSSPQTQMGRALAICFIPIAVGVMASFLNLVADTIVQSRHEYAQKKLKDHSLTLRDLQVWDSNGNGKVTREEFLEFMLVAMDQVEQETLDYLRELFDRMDYDKSGALDQGDVVTVAQFNLRQASYVMKR